MKIYWKAAKQAVSEWFQDGAMEQAAALGFYSIFAMAPSIVLCVMLAGLVFDEDQARNELLYQAGNLVGEQGEQAVSTILEHADQPDTSRLSFIISIGVLLFSASVVFAQLQTSLNRIWNVVQRPDLGIWFKVRSRLFSMGLVVSLGFLLILSLIISALLAAVGHRLTGIGLGDSTPPEGYPLRREHNRDYHSPRSRVQGDPGRQGAMARSVGGRLYHRLAVPIAFSGRRPRDFRHNGVHV